jgi:hypothetical protein
MRLPMQQLVSSSFQAIEVRLRPAAAGKDASMRIFSSDCEGLAVAAGGRCGPCLAQSLESINMTTLAARTQQPGATSTLNYAHLSTQQLVDKARYKQERTAAVRLQLLNAEKALAREQLRSSALMGVAQQVRLRYRAACGTTALVYCNFACAPNRCLSWRFVVAGGEL